MRHKKPSESVPDYYMLADGRQLIEWFDEEFVGLLGIYDPDPITLHCLLSASEHLFRIGRKPGTDQHDENASVWWNEKARKFHVRHLGKTRPELTETGKNTSFDRMLKIMFGNVAAQRDLAIRLQQRKEKRERYD